MLKGSRGLTWYLHKFNLSIGVVITMRPCSSLSLCLESFWLDWLANFGHVCALISWFVMSRCKVIFKILAYNPSATKKEIAVGLKGVWMCRVTFNPEVVVDVVKLKEAIAETLECGWWILNLPLWPLWTFSNSENCWLLPGLIIQIISRLQPERDKHACCHQTTQNFWTISRSICPLPLRCWTSLVWSS